MELPIKYVIINSGLNMSDIQPQPKTILKTIHNAGFFSCCTIRLLDIIAYYNENGKLPDEVDSTEQFLHYKTKPGDNVIPFFFHEETEKYMKLDVPVPVKVRFDCMAIQFDAYKNLDFEAITPFVKKYFEPSIPVCESLWNLEDKYKLDFANLCSVFYRGNDKVTEMKVASYDMFIEKAKEIKAANPEIRFLVQPDEKEFLEAFKRVFPDSIYFTETPMLNKMMSAMFFEIPVEQRGEYGRNFYAAVLCLSRCSHVITHSGNGALWLALYRGHADNIHQVFNDQWL